MYALILQRLFLEAFLDFFYFPVWWYTKGALNAGAWCFQLFRFGNQRLAPFVWVVNLFVPMFGQYDWEGRIISFIMRLIQIIFRGVGLIIWTVFCLLLFAVWLLMPLVITYELAVSFR